MIIVIISWIILLVVFYSFGEITTILWNIATKNNSPYTIIDKIWIGLCSVGVILLYSSIFIPLNLWILGLLIAVSIVHCIWDRRVLLNYLKYVKSYLQQLSLFKKGLFITTFIAILIYSLSTPLIYDEGLYHLQSMQWSEKYGAVLGLGNIHGRLGFNSTFLLLSTAFNYHPTHFLTLFTINSFTLLVFSFWIISQMVDFENFYKKAILAVVLLISLFSLGTNISSTSTDILPNILVMYLLLSWVLKSNIPKRPLLFALVSIFCVTLKLSSAMILLIAIAAIVIFYKKKKKVSIAIIVLGMVVAIPWIARFVILTGYLVYPFPAIDLFSVDWKIPLEMVIEEKNLAYAWGRIPDREVNTVLNMGFIEWFPIWVKSLSSYRLALYILALTSPLLILLRLRTDKSRQYLLAWAIAFIGILFSFLTAPDFRFAFSFIVCSATIPFLQLSSKITFLQKRKWFKTSFNIVLILAISCIIYIAFSQVKTYQDLNENSGLSLIYKPQPIDLLQRDNIFKEYKINNTTIFVPHGTNQCFEQDIPCLPYFKNKLEMRGCEIKDGFKINK